MATYIWISISCILLVQTAYCEESTFTNNGCSWSVTKDTHASGSTQSFKNISLVDCLNACRRLHGCLAVDYVIAERWCWWHTALDDLVNMNTKNGTDLYIHKTCGTPAGETYESNGCTWELQRNIHRPGTQWWEQKLGLEHCLDFCRLVPGCKGLDYVTTSGDCWLHVNVTSFEENDVDVQVGTQLYILDEGECEDLDDTVTYISNACEWTVQKYTHAHGATKSRLDVSLEGCLEQCRISSDCVGADYIWTQGNCWWHTNIEDLKKTSTVANTYLYVKNTQSCSSEVMKDTLELDGCKWEVTKDTHAFGSVESHADKNRDDCLMYCKAKGTECAGLDYIKSTGTCWIHQTSGNLQDTEADMGTDLYRKAGDNCNTILPEDYRQDGCEWMVVPYHHAVGSTISHSLGLEDCLNVCQNEPACLGLDYINATSVCWLHEDKTSLQNRKPSIESTLYIMVNRSQCETVKEESYELNGCTWSLKRNYHLRDPNARFQAGLKADECLEYCRNWLDCVALDYVLEQQHCWWHSGNKEALLDTKEPFLGTDLYVKTQQCGIDPTMTYNLEDCTWLVKKDVHAVGSSTSLFNTNLDSCLRVCAWNSSCQGLDYIANRQICWLHLDKTNLENIEVQTGTQLYTKQDGHGCNARSTSSPEMESSTMATDISSPKTQSGEKIMVSYMLLLSTSLMCLSVF